MPYGAPFDAAGLARVGFNPYRTPFMSPVYQQAIVEAEDYTNLTGSSYVVSNLTRSLLPVDYGPFGQHLAARLVDNSAAAFGSFGTTSLGVVANAPSENSLYFLLGSGNATSIARIVAVRGGVTTVTATIDIQVANGQIVAQSVTPASESSRVTFSTRLIQVAASVTWMRVGVTFDDTLGNFNSTLTLFPDVSDVTSVQGITAMGFMVATIPNDPQFIPTAAQFTELPYWSYQGSAASNNPSDGKILRPYLDQAYGFQTMGTGNQLVLNPWRDQGSLIRTSNNGTVTIPTIANATGADGWPDGWWCLIDVSNTINQGGGVANCFLGQQGTVSVTFRGDGTFNFNPAPTSLVNNSAEIPNLQDFNCSCFLLHKGTGDTNSWDLIPLWQEHGKALFTANGNFVWPFGVRQIRATGAGGGGGGGGGENAVGSAGGGGGSGDAVAHFAIANGVPNTVYAVTIGAGGANGLNIGTAGGLGGATSLGALLALAGGTGGAPGAAGVSGVGGASGGAGGMNGVGGDFPTAGAAGGALGGSGGSNIAGGVGGNSAGPVAVGSNGIRGGGGAGGSADTATASSQDGGDGGAGFLLLEW
jgi:hypothetical protein